MNKQDLAELLKYSSSEWIYVVTWNGLLKQIICPFRVAVIRDIATLYIGQIVWVTQVKVTMEVKTVFLIEGNAYYYFHFNILID